MNKYFIILLSFLIFLFSCNTSKNVLKNITEYHQFDTFKEEDYFELEKLRIENNLSFIETINLFNYPNFLSNISENFKSPLKDSPLILVNRHFYLDENYIPSDLVSVNNYSFNFVKRENEIILGKKEAFDSFQKMFNDMKKDNLNIYLFSAYRSYDKQVNIYNNSIDKTYVAKPGKSEHQSGYAIDISTLRYGLTTYFDDSPEFKWLKQNCYRYGFILRYLENTTSITGYSYEPWHFRYIGDDALNIRNEITFEHYLFSNYEIK